MKPKIRVILAALLIAFLAACGKKPEAAAPGGPPGMATTQSPTELICSYAPSQSNVVGHVASAAGGSAAAAAAIAKAAGLSAVLHSSGAYIFTGSAGYVAGTLGTAIVGPVLLGVSVAVGGSAATVELLCAPRNHPDMVSKVESAASDFYTRTKKNVSVASATVAPIVTELKKSVLRAGNEAIEYASRKSVEVSNSVKQ